MKVNGHELSITPASFAEAMALKKAVADAVRSNGLDLDLSGVNINGEDPMSSEVDGKTVGNLLENILALATSPVVTDQLFICAARAVLEIGKEKHKIDRDFFEDVDHRELYYPIMLEVLKVNLGPFFKNLGSLFGGISQMISGSPK